MFPFYFPVAGISVDALIPLGFGFAVGILSGMFGVGGGFLIYPGLLLAGVPPAVAVASQAPHILASSCSAVAAHWRRGNVDSTMGLLMALGGFTGAGGGIILFSLLRGAGMLDFVINVLYAILLLSVGLLMLWESISAILASQFGIRPGHADKRRKKSRSLPGQLPLRMRFRRSGLHISAIPPLVIGFLSGVLVSLMGIGGGFVLVPAMIFILGMPTRIAIGTSLFEITFVTSIVIVLHALESRALDAFLAMFLAIGGVLGAQVGTACGQRLQPEYVRGLMAILIVTVAAKIGLGMFAPPDNLFSVTIT